jgi:hypothetical protein
MRNFPLLDGVLLMITAVRSMGKNYDYHNGVLV